MSGRVHVFRRAVRFQEVDTAHVVFMGHYASYVHEALEAFFSELEGGYAGLVRRRNLGFPTVRLEHTYHAPFRYGDVARIEVSVEHVGTTSVRFRYRFYREGAPELVHDALHTVVCCTMDSLEKRPIPADARALLEAHRAR